MGSSLPLLGRGQAPREVSNRREVQLLAALALLKEAVLNKAEEVRARRLIYDAIHHLIAINRESLVGMAQCMSEKCELSVVQIISNA